MQVRTDSAEGARQLRQETERVRAELSVAQREAGSATARADFAKQQQDILEKQLDSLRKRADTQTAQVRESTRAVTCLPACHSLTCLHPVLPTRITSITCQYSQQPTVSPHQCVP
jgi:hypothetical protein